MLIFVVLWYAFGIAGSVMVWIVYARADGSSLRPSARALTAIALSAIGGVVTFTAGLCFAAAAVIAWVLSGDDGGRAETNRRIAP